MTASPRPSSDEVFDALPHRPLSVRHSVRMAVARDRGELTCASVPAVVILEDRPAAELANLRPDDWMLDEARQITHDHVITMAGEARLTGVVWAVIAGADALPMLDATTADLNHPSGLPVQQQMRELLESNPRAVLVVATVLVDQRRHRASLS